MARYNTVLIDNLRSFKDNSVNALVLRTEKEALEWVESLSSEDFIEELWLDHDLGEDEEKNVTSIIPFVNELKAKNHSGYAPNINIIYIHTSDFVGGKIVEKVLSKFYYTKRVYAGYYLDSI